MPTTAQRLRVAEGQGERAPAPTRTVPCMQTAWPHMLFPRPAAAVPLVFPFDQPALRYRYFARNAVWDAIRLLGLAGERVLMPAYHHGVELETLLAAGVKPVFFRVDAPMHCDFEDARAPAKSVVARGRRCAMRDGGSSRARTSSGSRPAPNISTSRTCTSG